MVAATSPPALANRFSEVKAQPGDLYFHVWAQRSAFLNVVEPITLSSMLPTMLPTLLVVEPVVLLLFPPA